MEAQCKADTYGERIMELCHWPRTSTESDGQGEREKVILFQFRKGVCVDIVECGKVAANPHSEHNRSDGVVGDSKEPILVCFDHSSRSSYEEILSGEYEGRR